MRWKNRASAGSPAPRLQILESPRRMNHQNPTPRFPRSPRHSSDVELSEHQEESPARQLTGLSFVVNQHGLTYFARSFNTCVSKPTRRASVACKLPSELASCV